MASPIWFRAIRFGSHVTDLKRAHKEKRIGQTPHRHTRTRTPNCRTHRPNDTRGHRFHRMHFQQCAQSRCRAGDSLARKKGSQFLQCTAHAHFGRVLPDTNRQAHITHRLAFEETDENGQAILFGQLFERSVQPRSQFCPGNLRV
jgi:hypothetical protein